eukprot:CAMPEP_0113465038 /NCGR_PEP_ID=MMETSP0014_2-20120614/13522_1 /TAXON_ID=2857 /ORGANISM="Nitzschia sp." /LENGTH=542 /DNA_ID=CAMNT_0000357161 /DNA_START=193 /DNA_END=1818 /DNA_ORIENTATION=- /assembly_acc=CAM_ASM_000159
MTNENINSNDSPLPPRPPPSFYQRKLPESTCVGFASAKGKKIFQSALQHDGLKSFYHLIQQYHTQTEPAFCGVSTLVMVLNTLSVDPHQHWKGPWRWYEEKMLNCCIDLETIKKTGITLRDFQCLALCQGLSVDLEYVYDDDDEEDKDEEDVDDDASDPTASPDTSDTPSSGLERFRRAVRNTCVEEPSRETDPDNVDDNSNGNDNGSDQNKDDDDDGPLSVLVVSYNRRTLKQTGTGHFSPIAAYDAASDSVLILDTARFKYGAHWVKLPLIYDAMKSIDPDSGKPRGYALLSFLPSTPLEIEPGEKTSHGEVMKTNTETNRRMSLSSDGQLQPMSIMFRMKMNQNEKRRKFKRFLQSLLSRDPSSKNSDNQADDNNSDHRHILLEQISSYLSGHRHHDDDNNKPHKKKEEDPCIWAIVEPMRVTDDVGKSMVAQMRTLLRDLRNNTKFVNQNGCGGRVREDDDDKDPQHSNNNKQSSSNCCDQSQFQMNYFVSSDEAMFVVYLAALSENERRDMVMNVESEVSDLIRQQLLMEADMIDSA